MSGISAASIYTCLQVLSESERVRVELVKKQGSGLIAVRKTFNTWHTPYYRLKEAQLAGIPRIYEVYPSDGKTVLIEAFINGENLLEHLRQTGPADACTAAGWMVQLCRILTALHQRGIIHRDIKPSNLILTPEGEIYLIDFEAARLYHPGKTTDTVHLGTRGYAAPEQFGYAQTDQRTDIYALGVVFNQLLCGCLPDERLYQGSLDRVIAGCIRLDPAQRYQQAGQVEQAIYAALYPNLPLLPPGLSHAGRYAAAPMASEPSPSPASAAAPFVFGASGGAGGRAPFYPDYRGYQALPPSSYPGAPGRGVPPVYQPKTINSRQLHAFFSALSYVLRVLGYFVGGGLLLLIVWGSVANQDLSLWPGKISLIFDTILLIEAPLIFFFDLFHVRSALTDRFAGKNRSRLSVSLFLIGIFLALWISAILTIVQVINPLLFPR